MYLHDLGLVDFWSLHISSACQLCLSAILHRQITSSDKPISLLDVRPAVRRPRDQAGVIAILEIRLGYCKLTFVVFEVSVLCFVQPRLRETVFGAVIGRYRAVFKSVFYS